MIIAVNTRFLLKNQLEGYGYFIKEVFRRLSKQHPEHQFYFLFDRPFSSEFVFSDNVKALVLSPPARHPLLWKYWYDVKVSYCLKRIKADVFVSPDGFCSLTTNVPQCLVIHDLGFIHHPGTYKKSHTFFYRLYTPKFLKKAQRIATVSEFSKNDILQNYNINESKIDVVYSAAREIFRNGSTEKQALVKEKYSDSKEFFLYVGAIQPRKNLVNLLKAFSIFKKRQRSNMKLVMAGRLAWKNDEFLKLYRTYKYKDDVVLTGYITENELADLTSSAYALVYPSSFEGFGVPVLEAMQSEVPALTSSNSAMQEITEEAALYFNAADSADIADKLMLIYKDENLRNVLIERGKNIVSKYTWQRTADLLWNSILHAANN
jgi:glycosyltransferase involved in cell wall biosynthesis